MRLPRFLFGFPVFACLAAAVLLSGPSMARTFDSPGLHASALDPLPLFTALPADTTREALAVKDETPESTRPIGDRYALDFRSAAQPGQRWRHSASWGFMPIDPDIRRR